MFEKLRRTIHRHPLAAFIALTFAWSWGCWAYLVITTPPNGMQEGVSPAFFLLAITGGVGPSLSAVLVSAALYGRPGVRDLFAQLKRWRFAPGWYAAALLLVPVVSILGLSLLTVLLGKPAAWGDLPGRLALGLIWPIFASLGEEFGWRAFALPRLQSRRSPLAASLIIGFMWGMWHLPTDFIANRSFGPLFIPYFLLAGPMLLTAQAVLMTWLYNRTNSMLPVVLYHFSITSSAIILPTLQLSVSESILSMGINTALFGLAAVTVAVVGLRRPSLAAAPGD